MTDIRILNKEQSKKMATLHCDRLIEVALSLRPQILNGDLDKASQSLAEVIAIANALLQDHVVEQLKQKVIGNARKIVSQEELFEME